MKSTRNTIISLILIWIFCFHHFDQITLQMSTVLLIFPPVSKVNLVHSQSCYTSIFLTPSYHERNESSLLTIYERWTLHSTTNFWHYSVKKTTKFRHFRNPRSHYIYYCLVELFIFCRYLIFRIIHRLIFFI